MLSLISTDSWIPRESIHQINGGGRVGEIELETVRRGREGAESKERIVRITIIKYLISGLSQEEH